MSLKEQYFKYSIIILILGLGIVIFFELIPFLGGLLGACTIYTLIRNQMKHLVEKRKIKRSIAAFLLIMETVLCFLIPISLVFDNESAAYQSRSSGGTCTGRTNIRIDKAKDRL